MEAGETSGGLYAMAGSKLGCGRVISRMKRLHMKTEWLVRLDLWGHLRALRDNCRGQDLIEYALLAGLGVAPMAPTRLKMFASMELATGGIGNFGG